MADEDDVNEDALEDADPDAEGEEGEGGEGGGKKKSKKKLIIIVAAVLLLAGGGAGVFFSGILDGGGGSNPEADAQMAMEKATSKHYFPLPEFLVNLNTSS